MIPYLKRKQALDLDEQLASFTDLVTKDSSNRAEVPGEHELQGLQEAVVRVRRAFPPVPVTEQAALRMQARVVPQAREALRESRTRQAGKDVRRKWALGLAAAMAVVGLAVISPLLTSEMQGGTASAISPTVGALAAAGIAGVLLLALLIRGRK
jgi:hypothetical protein